MFERWLTANGAALLDTRGVMPLREIMIGQVARAGLSITLGPLRPATTGQICTALGSLQCCGMSNRS
jgi:hypothetical protein